MLDVIRVVLCAAGAVYVALRLAGLLRSLAKGVVFDRPDKRLATQRRSDVASLREEATVSSSPFAD